MGENVVENSFGILKKTFKELLLKKIYISSSYLMLLLVACYIISFWMGGMSM
jgi:hypothetical protein